MKKFSRIGTLLTTLFILYTSNCKAIDNVKIHLFNQFNIKTVAISPIEGKYQFATEEGIVYRLKKNNIIVFTAIGDSISVWDHSAHIGMFKTINFRSITRQSIFKIESAYPSLPVRYYEGNVEIKANNHQLKVSNYVSINNYLAGVIEAESGPNAELEYYKTQAVISRTYLFSRILKEGLDQYYIGDDVNYQVYKGMCIINQNIRTAVTHTNDLVIIDTLNKLITATFHANSGGQTANSEDVWLSKTSYLKSTPDPFSIDQKSTIWHDTIPVSSFINFLNTQGIRLAADNVRLDLRFNQEQRQKYYYVKNDSVSLRKIRSHFKLRSTWFSMTPEGKNLILKGRGYGHGVGLSQQGAMEMAKQQFSFSDIIHFYYQNVRVVPFQSIYTP